MPKSDFSDRRAYLVETTKAGTIDLMGPTIRILTPPDATDPAPCLMLGSIPPDAIVPLHSHADPEIFILMSGELEGLTQTAGGHEWLRIEPGGIFHVPSGTRHAFRNSTRVPALAHIVTTSRMAKFFMEIGKPVAPGVESPPITAETVQHFLTVSQKYGYWNATPEENAEVGLILPPLQ